MKDVGGFPIDALWLDFMQMQEFARRPLVLVEGDGVYVVDDQGRRYLEGISGVFVTSLGHGNQRVVDAVREQVARLAFGSPTVAATDRAVELAARLLALGGGRYGAAKLHSSGSEAIEAAIKIARQYHRQRGEPSRQVVVSRSGSYHGATLGALAATGIGRFKEPFGPPAEGFLHVDAPGPWRCDACGGPCTGTCVAQFGDAIERAGPENVALVLVEPVMNMAGVVLPAPGYLEGLRDICDRFGVLLGYDEIVTAFGRCGAWFAADRYGVWPELLCLGKGLTAGYATLSAVLVANRIADGFRSDDGTERQYMSGHTFGGNPVACAAALAVIDEIAERDLLAAAEHAGARLQAGLAAICDAHDAARRVRSVGLLAALDLELDGDDERRRVATGVREGGLLAFGPSPDGTMRFAPPLVIADAEIDELLAIVDASLAR